MDYYIDLKLKPDAEMRENVLCNKVYTKLHKALFTMSITDIGVSFPNYTIKLGDVLRIHGTQQRLEVLQAMKWLGGLSGYCAVGGILTIPEKVKFRTVSRIQSNMTEAKLRRLIKRDSITPEEVKRYKAKMFSQGLDNPYVELESQSNGHLHRRFIHFGKISDVERLGVFDHFGLSKQATIPWF